MICKYCGKEFAKSCHKHIFCTLSCGKAFRALQSREKESETCFCRYCGKEFKPKVYDRRTYCSRGCAFAHKAAKPKIKTPKIKLLKIKPQHECACCGKMHERNSEYCSQRCYQKVARPPKASRIIKCNLCGNEFRVKGSGSQRRLYCATCAGLMQKIKRKEHKDKRRAIKRNAFVESVNRQHIYLRDRGCCGICGKKINKNFKAPHPMSLTLDHIIPLACGGTHEPKNVQLAHFICNSKKGANASPYGDQLRIY
jgi:5-methylcytosine-specific restriction endonuclease McrA